MKVNKELTINQKKRRFTARLFWLFLTNLKSKDYIIAKMKNLVNQAKQCNDCDMYVYLNRGIDNIKKDIKQYKKTYYSKRKE